MTRITRRSALAATAAGIAGAALAGKLGADQAPAAPVITRGRIKQSACRWCYRNLSAEELASHAKNIGLVGLDLLKVEEFPAVQKHGLICTMTSTHSIERGLNRRENWDECLSLIRQAIEASADAGFPNVICFSGNRAGMDPDEGLRNCAEALKQVVSLAEQKNVTVCMELLNSKQHKDYMCDNTAWGVALAKSVGSERFKLLYDIYHMQLMEGDIIATIRANKDYIAHYHTAGVPGRNEMDDSQELFYPAIVRAIIDTGFTGILAHEFIPKRDALKSLRDMTKLCDV